MEHTCDRKELKKDDDYFYGEAVTEIIYHEEDKVWLASNEEYGTVIRYCPFCGINLETGVSNCRKVKRLEGEDWVDVNFMNLVMGDKFRLFDEGPTPYEDGSRTWKAIGSPYIPSETGTATIQCEEVVDA